MTDNIEDLARAALEGVTALNVIDRHRESGPLPDGWTLIRCDDRVIHQITNKATDASGVFTASYRSWTAAEGLNLWASERAADEIERLRARAEKAEAERAATTRRLNAFLDDWGDELDMERVADLHRIIGGVDD